MEGKYIFAIIILSLFFILIVVAFAVLEYERKKEEKRQIWINERYASIAPGKEDYENVVDDEEIPLPSVRREAYDAEPEKEEAENVQLSMEDAYGKIDVDTEGIEEITGNYKDN